MNEATVSLRTYLSDKKMHNTRKTADCDFFFVECCDNDNWWMYILPLLVFTLSLCGNISSKCSFCILASKPSIKLSIDLLIHSFIPSFILSYIDTYGYPSVDPPTHPFIFSSIHLFINSTIYSSIHPALLVHGWSWR